MVSIVLLTNRFGSLEQSDRAVLLFLSAEGSPIELPRPVTFQEGFTPPLAFRNKFKRLTLPPEGSAYALLGAIGNYNRNYRTKRSWAIS